jgi:pyridoxamine 5'-phosphate oxidase
MEFIRKKKEYDKGTLSAKDLQKDPFKQFEGWLLEAEKEGVLEPYAMQIATASANGIPSIRTVLLRAFDGMGLIFFTSYESRKARELSEQPYASALFLWKDLERQIIVEGICEKISPELSDAYFNQRKRESQITAWTSHQDRPIPSRDFLEEQYQITESHYRGKTIPRPLYWGGYRLIPQRFEFWQGRKFRLHDRFEYVREGDNWLTRRLSP